MIEHVHFQTIVFISLSCFKTCGVSVISTEFTVCICFQDIDTTARIVLYDWQRGRIPYFTVPPETEEDEGAAAAASASSGPAGPAGHVPTEAAISEIPCVHVFDEEDQSVKNRIKMIETNQ